MCRAGMTAMSELHDRIEEACEGFVTRWVVVAEVVDGSQERELHVLSGSGINGDGPPPWDVAGMLAYATKITLEEDEED